MDNLKGMAIFATVVARGSMAAAAETLGMTPSAVSQQIRKLEAHAQVTLLHRTTRKLTLTEAGAAFYRSCAEMLAIAEEAEQRLGEWREAPVGELRLAAPVGFSGKLITEALRPLLENHRQLRLQLFFHDEQIDLIEQRIDLAIRVGNLADSSLVARHLAEWNNLVCAAPAYLHRCGLIEHPQQLMQVDWLSLNTRGQGQSVQFEAADGETCRLRLEPRVAANSMIALRQFTLDGLGISLQPEPEVREALEEGRLVRLLPQWTLPSFGIYAVTPRRDAQPAKVKVAIEALRRHLGGIAPVQREAAVRSRTA